MTTHTIITEKMIYGGDCISKIDGKTVFVPQSLPNEELKIQITESKRDYDVAKIIEIIKPSEHRVSPFCQYYGKCGGCNMQHISDDYQKQLRKNMLQESFLRNGISEDKIPEIQVISGETREYRSRFQLHDGCLKSRNGETSIPINDCPIAVPSIRKYLQQTPVEKRPKGRVNIFADDNGVVIAQDEISTNTEKKSVFGNPNAKKNKKVIRSKNKRHIYQGSTIKTENICSITITPEKTIKFDVRGFFQSNIEILKKAIVEICRNMGGDNVLDMYCGAGTFSVFLADIFKHVTLVEHNRDALVFAEQNMLGKSHTSYGVSGEKWILTQKEHFDAVVIDPPRSGIENGIRKWLKNPYADGSKIPQLRYLSCDPVTIARDTAELLQAGYDLAKLYLLDFYPQTTHIESLACFEYFPVDN